MSINELNKVILPIIRDVMPNILARDIIGFSTFNSFNYRYKIRDNFIVCYFMDKDKIFKLIEYCLENNIQYKFAKFDKLDTSLIIKCNTEEDVLYIKMKELI